MNRERLLSEAAALLAAETMRLIGIQGEVIAHIGPIPEALAADLELQKSAYREALGVVQRLS
jgi:hypothetical protein